MALTTRLLRVETNVGRTGTINPLAILDPVEVGGVVVKQATLHNYDDVARKDIRVGDTVIVKRAGDVIPYVIGPVPGLRDGSEEVIVPPTTCPSCGEQSDLGFVVRPFRPSRVPMRPRGGEQPPRARDVRRTAKGAVRQQRGGRAARRRIAVRREAAGSS